MTGAKELLYPIAEQLKERETEMRFFYAGDNDDDDIVSSLRGFANLPSKNPLVVIIDIPDQQVGCTHLQCRLTSIFHTPTFSAFMRVHV